MVKRLSKLTMVILDVFYMPTNLSYLQYIFPVFFHLSYEDSANLESIQNQEEYEAAVSQIQNFGQTPPQLFQKPHPARQVFNMAKEPQKELSVYKYRLPNESSPVRFLHFNGNQILSLTDDGFVGIHKWTFSPFSTFPFTLELDKSERKKGLDIEYKGGIGLKSSCFALSLDCSTLFLSGLWDNSIKLALIKDLQICTNIHFD